MSAGKAAVTAACLFFLPHQYGVAQTDDEVLVTASRYNEPLSSTLASANVIDRATIEARQYATLERALLDLPGVSIGNTGGVGKASSLFVRGAESDHNLVLVNGLRWGSATLGSSAIQDIPLELVERIEIVRGPRSALYGADALGSVVQIFTRSAPQSSGLKPEFSLGYGENSTLRASAGLGARFEQAYFQFNSAFFENAGTNALRFDDPDRDGYRNHSMSLRAGFNLNADTVIEAIFSGANSHVQFDNFLTAADNQQRFSGVSINSNVNSRSQLSAQLGRTIDKSDSFAGEFFAGNFDTTRDVLNLQWNFDARDNLLLTSGIDLLRDQVDSVFQYDESSRRNSAAFTQARLGIGNHTLQAGVRYDDNEQFGGETTGSLAWGLKLSPAWLFTASAGTAFKAPSFNDLYFPDFGNPNLNPERAKSLETSLRWIQSNFQASLTAYQNEIDDLIAFNPATFAPFNIFETRIRGVEATARRQLGNWDISGSAEWLEPQIRSAGSLQNNLLPRRSETTLRSSLSYRQSHWQVGGQIRYEGRRFDDAANTLRVGGFTVLDLQSEWRIDNATCLQLRLDNALDRSYETVAFYPQPGREVHFLIRYSPGT